MDLADVDEFTVSPQREDRVLISWRRSDTWSMFALVDEDSGYVDPEDILWWLLRQGAALELIRPALAAVYPDFDPDAEIEHVTMPDRIERRAADAQRRLRARAAFEGEQRKR